MESDRRDLVSQLIEMIPADEIKRIIETVRRQIRASEGIRATVLSEIASAKEEGSDDPGVLLRGQRRDKRSVGGVGSMRRRTEGFLKVTNRSSQSIIIESLSRRKGEQQDDSHQEEEDSASATSENGKREVAKRPTATT